MKLSKIEINELKELFIRLTSTDNQSKKEEKIAQAIIHELAPLGIIPQVDELHNIFFHIEGKGTPLFLNAHMDSVDPCVNKEIIFENDIFSTKGDTVLGADDLEGVAIAIATIKYFKKHKITHRPLDILFTTQEEVGGVGIKNFNLSLLKAKEGLVLDSAAPVGKFVIKAPAKYNFEFFIKGIAGHGSQTKNTFSAIVMMSDIIYQLPVGRIDEFTKLNIGRIEGGKSLNTIPGSAYINGGISVFSDGEIRGSNIACEKIIKKIKEIILLTEKKYPKGNIEFKYEKVRPSYELNENDDFIKSIKVEIQKLGLTPEGVKSNGVSDSNTLHSLGYKGVLMGTGATGLHTINEKVSLTDIVKLMEITLLVCSNGK